MSSSLSPDFIDAEFLPQGAAFAGGYLIVVFSLRQTIPGHQPLVLGPFRVRVSYEEACNAVDQFTTGLCDTHPGIAEAWIRSLSGVLNAIVDQQQTDAQDAVSEAQKIITRNDIDGQHGDSV